MTTPTPQLPDARRRRESHTASRVLLVGIALVYVVVLHQSYVAIIAPAFTYLGYAYHPLPWAIEFASLTLAVIPSLVAPVRVTRPSQLVFWFLYLLVYVPSVLFPGHALNLSDARLVALFATLSACLSLILAVSQLPLLLIPQVVLRKQVFWIVYGFTTLVLYAGVVRTFGLTLKIPSWAEVYVTRAQYKQQLAASAGLTSYFTTWIAEVFNPILLIAGVLKRQTVLVVIALVSQVLLYSMTGFKSVALALGVLVAILFATRGPRPRLGLALLTGVTALVMTCVAIDIVTKNIVLTSVFVRRAIITPGLITGMYFEYFSNHDLALYSRSFLGWLAPARYSTDIPKLIGAVYFPGEGTNANGNIWADAFANFGLSGMLVMSLIMSGFLWLTDSLLRVQGSRVAILLTAVPAMALCNSAFPTVVLTHGFALVLLCGYLLPPATGAAEPTSRPATLKRRGWLDTTALPVTT